MKAPKNPTLFRPLARRPEATTLTVRVLIQKVQSGEVRVPKFQRPLRWQDEDVRKLLDSIWRGYPVGSLLFWKHPAEAEYVKIGGATIEAPAVADAWWVVDGQQRTTALAASLLELDHAGDTRWILRFDPEREEFVVGAPSPDRVGIDVPLPVLGDLRRLGRWLRDEGRLPEDAVTRVEAAQQRILDYAIPAIFVDTDDEEALRAVFARLNSTGARMRADEVFQALLGAPSGMKPYLDLNGLQRGCDIDGFGELPRGEILKAVLAMSGIDPRRRPDNLGDNDLTGLVSREAAEEALSRTIAFLQSECGIPHVRLIPYPVVFIILSRWFYVFPKSAPATLAMLSRWLWRGAATGAHERAAVSRMREQLTDIKAEDEQGSLDRLLRRCGTPPQGPWELEPFNLKGARSRIETLALLALEPRDPFGPVSTRALVSGERVAREVFAAQAWRELGTNDRMLARTAANRILLDDANTGLASVVRNWDPEFYSDALRSHLIDRESFEALVHRDVGAFLRRRAGAVQQEVKAFIDRHACWDEPVIRTIEYYQDPEEP